jgi:hypothetical protein
MRSFLVLGLLMTLCASANAATVNHSHTHHHVTVSNRQGVTSGFAVASWAYAAPRSPIGGGGFGGGGHIGRFGGVRVRGWAVDGMGRFGASYISLGDHDVHHHTMLRYGRYWSGYSLYAYDRDPYDFFSASRLSLAADQLGSVGIRREFVMAAARWILDGSLRRSFDWSCRAHTDAFEPLRPGAAICNLLVDGERLCAARMLGDDDLSAAHVELGDNGVAVECLVGDRRRPIPRRAAASPAYPDSRSKFTFASILHR